MRILGIDPGVADTGWAVVEQPRPADPARLCAAGVIRTAPPSPLPERLRAIHAELALLLAGHRPDVLAVEEMFFLKRADTMRATLQARGVVLLAAAQARTEVVEYNPRRVKSVLTGSGRAEKAQMQRMVQRALALAEPLRPDDTADAAAIALCHLRSSRYRRLRVLDRVGKDWRRALPESA